jgi:hypothetical protein
MTQIAIVLALLLAVVPAHSADRENRRKSAGEKKSEALRDFSRRLRKVSGTNLTPEQQFLHNRVQELLQRASDAPAASYLFDRLEAAIEDLIDSTEELKKLGGDAKEDEDDDRRRTARDLEKTYFRVTQAGYFARLSKDVNGGAYVDTARRLYQNARHEYDRDQFWRARRFAGAARELVNGLESLAQAAVPVPEPPALKD